jgi:hypothetical protein
VSISPTRRFAVWGSAAVLCLLGSLVALAVWAVGLGHYLEDYCFTRAPSPADEGVVVTGPVVRWPATLRCEYDPPYPDVVVTDWSPLLWTAGCAVVTLTGVAVVLVLARFMSGRPRL